MTLAIQFTPREEAWLYTQANQQGLQPAEVVRRLVDERLPALDVSAVPVKTASVIDAERAATIALLQSWIDEAPTDPEEIRQAEAEFAEFMENLNSNRVEAGERPLFP